MRTLRQRDTVVHQRSVLLPSDFSICLVECFAGVRVRSGRKVLLPKKNEISTLWVNKAQSEARTIQYVGSQVCGECHSDKYDGFRRTAHHRTSREPSRDSILGRFDAEQNVLRTKDSNLYFLMKAAKDGFYQSVFAKYDGQFY